MDSTAVSWSLTTIEKRTSIRDWTDGMCFFKAWNTGCCVPDKAANEVTTD